MIQGEKTQSLLQQGFYFKVRVTIVLLHDVCCNWKIVAFCDIMFEAKSQDLSKFGMFELLTYFTSSMKIFKQCSGRICKKQATQS